MDSPRGNKIVERGRDVLILDGRPRTAGACAWLEP